MSYELICDGCNQPTGCWVHSSTPRPVMLCGPCHDAAENNDDEAKP